MPVNLPPELQQANAYLQAGQKQAARLILVDFVSRQPNAELAWLMLSRTLDDPRQRADCLRQALRINPQNHDARRQIETLLAGSAAGSAPQTTAPQPALKPASARPAWAAPAKTAWSPPPLPLDLMASQDAAAHETSGELPAPILKDETEKLAEKAAQPEGSSSATAQFTTGKPPSRQNQPGLGKGKIIALLAFGAIVAVLSCVAGWLALSQLLPGGPAQPPLAGPVTRAASLAAASATPSPGPAGLVLPPTWTATPSATASATPTITPTPAPSLTPTYPGPPPTIAALMGRIEEEVADLRGLPIQQRPPRYLVPKPLVEQMLKNELEATGGIEALKDEARFLSALGLIKPTYDLVRYAMNGLVDGMGGFYRPDTKEIYVIGLQFRGTEHFVYAHEFDHALVDQRFDLERLQDQDLCTGQTDRCLAVRALVEGDATLLMMQWLKQYASPQDYRDLFNYRMPAQALPEQYPPDYVTHALNFPYEAGLLFVNQLYTTGNWARVNQAYANPPISSEQVLHPEKYLAGEAPIVLQDPSLELALDGAWRRIKGEALGEFHTYLLLAHSADVPARRKEDAARKAAAGWGGDQVQAFYNEQSDQTVLAAHWIWDTPTDAQEFELSMREALDMLMRGSRLERPVGHCWEANEKATCLYIKGSETLWLSAPDQATLEPVILLFSNLTSP